MRNLQHAYVRFLGGVLERSRFVVRRDQHLDELSIQDGLGGSGVQRLVEGDDAAERAGRIGGIRQFVGVAAGHADRHATWIGMLDDDTGRRVELAHAFPRCIGIGQIVEAQFLALQLLERRQRARHRIQIAVERAGLVRILAVAQIHHLDETGIHLRRELAARGHRGRCVGHCRQVVADGRIVLGDAIERSDRQRKARGGRHCAIIGIQFVDERSVLGRIGSHRDTREILGRRTQHRRAADIDVLDRIFQRAIRLHGNLLEWIQVQHQQIDGSDAMLRHHRIVGAAASKQAAMDIRMQRLDPAVHDFRKTGDLRDIADRQPGVAQCPGGAAGGQQFDIAGGQRLGQIDQAGFVGNGQQSPADGREIDGHWRAKRKGGGNYSREPLRPRVEPLRPDRSP
jgi:hypothetical protein